MNCSRVPIFNLIAIILLMTGVMIAAFPHTVQPSGNEWAEVASDYGELSPEQEQAMWEEIQRNIESLRRTGVLITPNAAQTVLYNFPLRMTPGLDDFAGFRVSVFSDHNPTAGQVLDYNGGARTYDGHRGTDYALYPFSWNKLDAGDVQVIAAAAGTIVYRNNVDPTDHNCNVSSADDWNAIALTHADGRMTIYGHMRYNSLTSKGIGAPVAQSEYLGTVASSGNSSGPHLHFEARYGNFTTAEWIDPYAGPNSQPGSLWANQRPYYDSAINKLSTHSSSPSTPDPCQPSTTNLQDNFTTLNNIYLYAFYRDYQGTITTQLNLYRPNGSVYKAWQYAPGSPAFSSVWSNGWVENLAANESAGTWRFEATYNGQVYQTFFNVNAPTTITVTSPNGGQQWSKQIAHAVTWSDNLGGDVNITLYRNSVYSATIANNVPSNGQYLWVPSNTLVSGSGYTVRVISVINPAIYDESNAPFSLVDASGDVLGVFFPLIQR